MTDQPYETRNPADLGRGGLGGSLATADQFVRACATARLAQPDVGRCARAGPGPGHCSRSAGWSRPTSNPWLAW